MPAFSPEKIAAATGGWWTRPPGETMSGFTQDTRQLSPGQVFVAIRTDRRDGHDFLAQARERGAAAAIVSRENPAVPLPQLVVPNPLTAFQAIAREHRREFPGSVIGISGSAGKTSTKDLLALLLGGAPAVLATEGNLNNQIGVPLTLTRLEPAQHQFAVVEAGISAPGEMAPLARMIAPDVALITLVAPAHLDALGTVDGVAREKALLPAAVRPGGIALFPQACAEFSAFAGLNVRRLVIEPAGVARRSAPPPDRVYYAITQRVDETSIALAYGPPPPLHFTLRRVSQGIAQDVVLALTAALWLGVNPEVIQQRLGAWQPVPWRGEQRRIGGATCYCDFYNASPASMADALDAFMGMAPAHQPRLYVLGCMEELGAGSADYHRQLGRSLHLRPGDFLFLLGDQAAAVRSGAIASGHAAAQIAIIADLQPVRARLAGFTGTVFMKGSRRYHLETALEPSASDPVHA
ncbi:MAG: UDP-N-acetylmuramoyl-tripeptide--D-alanyl-D-alanine ligase [Opitutaceae bacterium]|nr:UDP-N-acetylmuramoyl-tripeptide--D-alanyl-D-alanine ligase [Opitutaceae bacterium]